MKSCFKCGAEKPLSEFYKHKMMADGHVNKCKSCNKADVTANRELKADKYKAYDKTRAKNLDRVEGRKSYLLTEAGKTSKAKATRKYIEANPKKRSVHMKVGNAIRDLKLFRRPCEVCGAESNIVAHHCDYDKPLDIMWLCTAHHAGWHRVNGEGLNPSY